MIEIDHLRKCFGPLVAVDDISFTVDAGEVLGFLGPNGAGKSTTMKVLTGFLAPTAGKVRVCGYDIETDTLAAQRKIGYLPEGAPCYDEMTPFKFLRFIAEVRGYRKGERDQRVRKVIEQMSLEDVVNQRIETLSKGFKRRVGLAQAIIHDPEVLVLDEPTDGLDPNQKHQVRELIRSLSRDKIVIISTHILEEVTAVCTRALIIARGKLLLDCKPAELEQRSRYHGAVTVRARETSVTGELQAKLSTLGSVSSVEISADRMEVTAFRKDPEIPILGQVGELVRGSALNIEGVYQEKGRLDEVFRKVTGEAST